MQKILIISQVRLGSTRLPGKVLKSVLNKTMLFYFVKRIELVKTPHDFILAIAESNQPLIDFAKKFNILYFVGSELDVLDRTYKAAKKFNGDIIVRITSDCPLSDPDVIDQALDLFLEGNCDYLSNDLPATFPFGIDVEVFSFKALEITWKKAKDPFEREHVSLFIKNNQDLFISKNFKNNIDLSSISFELDTYEDYLFLSKIIEHFHDCWESFRMKDLLYFLKANPELLKINSQYEKNIDLLKSLNLD